ncbi:hypothetical protein [Flavobacterium tegetincola]|uniref:hypothetical protein n=1 Tax=Flavobacterium tegetincola TaxID=150172 RepID=UPI00041EED69|nr:hypothetical protein [Flavobacterium tegetincola]
MKNLNLIDDFSAYELLNAQNIVGGGRGNLVLTSTTVVGTYTNGSGQTFMDIRFGDGSTVCDSPDSDWGGTQYPVGSEIG